MATKEKQATLLQFLFVNVTKYTSQVNHWVLPFVDHYSIHKVSWSLLRVIKEENKKVKQVDKWRKYVYFFYKPLMP